MDDRAPGRLPVFRAQISHGGNDPHLGVGAGLRRDLMLRVSIHAHKFRDEDQKKGLCHEI